MTLVEAADLKLAPLQASHRLENGLDGVPLHTVEQVHPAAVHVLIHALVQQYLQVVDVERVALSRKQFIFRRNGSTSFASYLC